MRRKSSEMPRRLSSSETDEAIERLDARISELERLKSGGVRFDDPRAGRVARAIEETVTEFFAGSQTARDYQYHQIQYGNQNTEDDDNDRQEQFERGIEHNIEDLRGLTVLLEERRPKTAFTKDAEPTATAVESLHPEILSRCRKLLESGEYAEAVEKSFKVVRDRLRVLTGHETGADAFGKGHLHVEGAAAPHVDDDFQKGVQFLTMAIDRFRNEKSHTADGNITDPIRAYEYLRLSSLAIHLLEKAGVPRVDA
jgi:uncharacterized protein (TIGR02391 family)